MSLSSTTSHPFCNKMKFFSLANCAIHSHSKTFFCFFRLLLSTACKPVHETVFDSLLAADMMQMIED